MKSQKSGLKVKVDILLKNGFEANWGNKKIKKISNKAFF